MGSLAGPREAGTTHAPNFEASSQFRRQAAHSFGMGEGKRGRVFLPPRATPPNVGPNSYHPNHNTLDSQPKQPRTVFPQAKRVMHSVDRSRYWDTFVDYSSMGSQPASHNRTESEVTIARAKKGNPFVGFVERRVLKVPMQHAVY